MPKHEIKTDAFQRSRFRLSAQRARAAQRDMQLAPDWTIDLLDDLDALEGERDRMPDRIFKALGIEVHNSPSLRKIDPAMVAVEVSAVTVRSEYRKNTALRDKIETLDERLADAAAIRRALGVSDSMDAEAVVAAVEQMRAENAAAVALLGAPVSDRSLGVDGQPIRIESVGELEAIKRARDAGMRAGVLSCIRAVEGAGVLEYPSQVADRLRALLERGGIPF